MFPPAFAAGTAMTEMVLVMPFFAVILSLTFFFGWAMMHKEQVLLASRYSAWSRVDTGTWADEARLNNIVFANKAATLTLDQTGYDAADSGGGNTTPADLVTAVGAVNQVAAALADETVNKQFPHGYRSSVSAEFAPRQNFWAAFRGAISGHDSREGFPWRRADSTSPWNVLRDQFYSPFDTALESVAPPANDMAQMIRDLYLGYW
jgi:Flp pilus assembly protein TadG